MWRRLNISSVGCKCNVQLLIIYKRRLCRWPIIEFISNINKKKVIIKCNNNIKCDGCAPHKHCQQWQWNEWWNSINSPANNTIKVLLKKVYRISLIVSVWLSNNGVPQDVIIIFIVAFSRFSSSAQQPIISVVNIPKPGPAPLCFGSFPKAIHDHDDDHARVTKISGK